ncbi:ATP-dependent helicase, partial [Pseudomonas aeruginosa]
IQDLRHTNTEKYAAASELAALAEDVIGFSGTPIYNRGHEIWSITNILEYQCLGDRDSFAREWCWHDGEKS